MRIRFVHLELEFGAYLGFGISYLEFFNLMHCALYEKS